MVIVTVCTANLCRSPFAERVLARLFTEQGIDVQVRSTGVDALTGWPCPAGWIAVAAEFGVDLRDHRSVAPDSVLGDADLALVMTADHLRSLVVPRPELLARATTLGGAAARAVRGVRGVPLTDTATPAVVGMLVGPQRAMDVLNAERDLDVADPVARSRRFQRAIAVQIVDLCTRIVAAWPMSPGPPDPARPRTA